MQSEEKIKLMSKLIDLEKCSWGFILLKEGVGERIRRSKLLAQG